MQTRYYTGGRFKGQGWRDLEPDEIRTVLDLAANAVTGTRGEQVAARTERDRFVIALFEDGVAASSIAKIGAPRLTVENVERIIAKRRRELGRGVRRAIAPDAENATVTRPARRLLTADEEARLRALDSLVPRLPSGNRHLASPQGDDLIGYADTLARDRVALASIGNVLGLTREYVRQRIDRHRAGRR